MFSCSDNSEDLAAFAGVENSTEEEEDRLVFSEKFCNPCHSKMNRARKAIEDGVPFYSIAAMEWSPHVDDCEVRGGKIRGKH